MFSCIISFIPYYPISSQYPLPHHPSTLYLVIPVRDTGIYIYYGQAIG
ncbi:hypothetical protein [Wolbachia endosymbiont (group A) of Lasioglossum morio]|nr:hypothetical protein [Wolbachia endosymbiont (group A) of Lasioglossum morio]